MRVARSFVFFLLLFCLSSQSFSQAKRAANLIDKLKYEQARELLSKSITKDSIDAAAKYVMSLLYFTSDYGSYNIDSAHLYIMEAINDYSKSDIKTISRLNREGIINDTLYRQKNNVELAAWESAKKVHNAATYQSYIDTYPSSLLLDSAIWVRNRVEFQKADQVHTWSSYLDFIEKYPNAEDYEEADKRYQLLLYEDLTKDNKKVSIENFIRDYPNNNHRKEAENRLFNILTGTHQTSDYLYFSDKYSNYELGLKAAKRLYHLLNTHSENLESKDLNLIRKYLDLDSLDQLRELNEKTLFPISQNAGFVFLSTEGHIIEGIDMSNIDPRYACGNISSEFIILNSENYQLVNRKGKPIFISNNPLEFRDLGSGLLLVETQNRTFVLFKWGDPILEGDYEEIRLIDDRYIAAQSNDNWGLFSVTGVAMLPMIYEDIVNDGPFVRIQQEGKFDLVKPEALLPLVNGEAIEIIPRYVETQWQDDSLLLVSMNKMNAVLDLNMEAIVDFDHHSIVKTGFGYLVEKADGFTLASQHVDIEDSVLWETVDYDSYWLSLKGADGLTLISADSFRILGSALDSIKLVNRSVALVYDENKRILQFSNGKSIPLADDVQFEAIVAPPIDGKIPAYYMKLTDLKKTLYINEKADSLEIPDDVTFRALGEEFIVITKNNEWGLLNSNGDQILEMEYDGIANYRDGSVTLLQDGKLGYYSASDSVLILPDYNRAIQPLSDTVLLAQKENGFGLISATNDIVVPFEYDEIQQMNDSLYWLKDELTWSLHNITDSSLWLTEIKDFENIEDLPGYYSYVSQTGKGLISSKFGTIINASFNEIVNLGSENDPVFLAEKYFDEADYFILVYYDQFGQVLHKGAYSSEQYENLICEK